MMKAEERDHAPVMAGRQHKGIKLDADYDPVIKMTKL